jgi:glycosyltransferase involved in cell wall biosynthesis
LIGTLGGFRPYVLSVWGSDILVFPAGSRLRRLLIKYPLGRANLILTTSMAMAREARRYTSGRVEVTPFGVDVDRFRPGTAERRLFRPDDVVVGTVKALYPEYGVDSLIEAFRIVRARRPGVRLKLLTVGGGPQERALKGAIRARGLEGDTLFSGHVDYDAVPDYYRALTVYVALSQTEGFGVSIAEACASGKPVVVSAAGGLPEVVDDGVTGFVVPVGDVERAANAIERLVVDERLREAMGRAGRQRVERLYDWKDSIERMLRVYGDVLSDRSRGAALETR